jgi:predicted acetyltransferase
MDVDLLAVAAADKPVIANLLQLYLHDSSEFEPSELSAHGTFDYAWLDSYFTEPTREALLITVAGRPAGFALARCDVDGDEGAWNVGEFFVVRGHRGRARGQGEGQWQDQGRGVAGQAARLLFRRHPGPWTLSYLPANVPASRFWPKLVGSVAVGPVSRHEFQASEGSAAKVRLRFRIEP